MAENFASIGHHFILAGAADIVQEPAVVFTKSVGERLGAGRAGGVLLQTAEDCGHGDRHELRSDPFAEAGFLGGGLGQLGRDDLRQQIGHGHELGFLA